MAAVTPVTLYFSLLQYFGPQKWWPVDKKYHEKNSTDPRFEIIVGAVLTQNTAWKNVEKALENLRSNNALTITSIAKMDIDRLSDMIKPSGYFNQKAFRLKKLSLYLQERYNGDLNRFFNRETVDIRNELLSLSGVGPETADSILLYAGGHPIFVVDAYTRRICNRLPITVDGKTYDDIRQCFERDIQRRFPTEKLVSIYGELHALIVVFGKTFCKKKPVCRNCPMNSTCIYREKEVFSF
ncbi:MAG: endonuclease [Thermoplasmata archaeon]|nr:MAG: endonuclease [Thermoplasmata archaeon]